ncbi:MAG TPA: CBS domain-containing protein [Solirubrobacteraceae bacterium]|jgi:CBS domain-containing protein|nr:CBS domain-containing protein [Solirubrobacteraceae bacterium]
MADVPQPVVHLSSVLHSPLLDRGGERLGRVEDLIVRLADGGYPPVTGLKARIGGRELFVPIDKVATLQAGSVRLAGEKLSLGRFERRVGEVLLRQDVLGRKLVNVEADPPRLVTAREIELACIEGWWRVVGLDSSFSAQLRRVLPRPLKGLVRDRPFLDWSDMEPFVDHVPTARLRFSHRKLANLHPAEIADLVEAASHEEGEEIIKAVAQDRELEADVFEELDEHHQLEFIRERPDEQAAAVIARMAADDAADLIEEIDQERRARLLALLPFAQRRQIESLLGYNPSTAGGLMSPDFIALGEDDSVEHALERVRRSDIGPATLTTIYLHDSAQRLCGSVPIVGLIRARPQALLGEIAEHEPVYVQTGADLPEVARMMTDYNLLTLPVVQEDQHIVGVITVDDVLELTLPPGWRRRFGLVSD